MEVLNEITQKAWDYYTHFSAASCILWDLHEVITGAKAHSLVELRDSFDAIFSLYSLNMLVTGISFDEWAREKIREKKERVWKF